MTTRKLVDPTLIVPASFGNQQKTGLTWLLLISFFLVLTSPGWLHDYVACITFNVAYSIPYITIVWHYSMVILKPILPCICTVLLEHTPVLWYCLEWSWKAGNLLSLGIGNIFVLLGRRLSHGIQASRVRFIWALWYQSPSRPCGIKLLLFYL